MDHFSRTPVTSTKIQTWSKLVDDADARAALAFSDVSGDGGNVNSAEEQEEHRRAEDAGTALAARFANGFAGRHGYARLSYLALTANRWIVRADPAQSE